MGFKHFAKKAVKKSANPTKLIPGKLNPVNKIVPSKFRSFVDPMATIQKIDPTKPTDVLTMGTNRLPGMSQGIGGLTSMAAMKMAGQPQQMGQDPQQNQGEYGSFQQNSGNGGFQQHSGYGGIKQRRGFNKMNSGYGIGGGYGQKSGYGPQQSVGSSNMMLPTSDYFN